MKNFLIGAALAALSALLVSADRASADEPVGSTARLDSYTVDTVECLSNVMDMNDIMLELVGKYGERVIGVRRDFPEVGFEFTELLNSETGTWTILTVHLDSMTGCMSAFGIDPAA